MRGILIPKEYAHLNKLQPKKKKKKVMNISSNPKIWGCYMNTFWPLEFTRDILFIRPQSFSCLFIF
jgi:hypothetical protein